jgi:hypothetical protein
VTSSCMCWPCVNQGLLLVNFGVLIGADIDMDGNVGLLIADGAPTSIHLFGPQAGVGDIQ